MTPQEAENLLADIPGYTRLKEQLPNLEETWVRQLAFYVQACGGQPVQIEYDQTTGVIGVHYVEQRPLEYITVEISQAEPECVAEPNPSGVQA